MQDYEIVIFWNFFPVNVLSYFLQDQFSLVPYFFMVIISKQGVDIWCVETQLFSKTIEKNSSFFFVQVAFKKVMLYCLHLSTFTKSWTTLSELMSVVIQ